MDQLLPIDLTCGQRRDPLGIDTAQPQLGWALDGGGRDAVQSAWHIQVGSAPGLGDCWDSGRVAGDRQFGIAYAGAALRPRTRYHWRVRVWDGAGRDSAWSDSAWFETAFLDPAAFAAPWLGTVPEHDDERPELAAAQWVWSDDPAAAQAKAMLLRTEVELPADAVVARARLIYWAEGREDSWRWNRPFLLVNGTCRDQWRSLVMQRAPGEWDVTSALKPGVNRIAARTWVKPGSAYIALLAVELADGRRLAFATGTHAWWCRPLADESDPPGWDDPASSGWQPVAMRGAFGHGPWPAEDVRNRSNHLIPPCILRRSVAVRPGLVRARLYATACGIYTAELNGARIGDHWLAPGWTAYHKRLNYQTHDVTALLAPGANELFVTVADGWYSGQTFLGHHTWGTDKAARLQLHLDYADGGSEVVDSSPAGWQAGTGPLRFAELFHGQHEDRRTAPRWRPATVLHPEHGVLQAQPDEPVRSHQELAVRSLVERRPGVYLADFAQNLAGVVRLRLRAPRGTRVTLRFAEVLGADGDIYIDNLRSARATDVLICAGGGEEVFEPRLTFHGFRYCEISGLPGGLRPDQLTAVAITSDLADAATFTCDNPLLMRLQENIRWGWRDNSISIPTDCPQRDERMGWTGDALVFVRTALFNTAGGPFWSKFQQDMVDAQHPASGAMPDFAPCHTAPEHTHYGWGDAAVVVPWTTWRLTGDTGVITRHWEALRRFLAHRDDRSPGEQSVDWSFGDWVSPKPQTPNEVLGPVYHAWMHRLMAEMAQAIGRDADAAHHRRRFAAVAEVWRTRNLGADGRIHTSDTQAAYACALRAGVIPDALVAAAGTHLVAAIERAGWHLATGFLGTGNLLPALAQAGRSDVAWRLLLTESAPGWLFSVLNGATTMWERWNGYDPLRGPTDSGMNSFNHYAFGAVGEWMYAAIGGLDRAEDDVAFQRLVIRPVPGGCCRHAGCTYRGVRGTATSRWWLADGRFSLHITVPPNCTAEVHVPTALGAGSVVSDGARHLRDTATHAIYAVGAGDWRFSAPG